MFMKCQSVAAAFLLGFASAFVVPHRLSLTDTHQTTVFRPPMTLVVFDSLATKPRRPFLSTLALSSTGKDDAEDDNVLLLLPVPSKKKDAKSLTTFLQEWATETFSSSSSGLTTPVTLRSTPNGIRMEFKDTKTDYKSKKEEEEEEEEENASSKDKDETPKLQGGVDIEVISSDDGLQVKVTRCNLDDDTVIKEMSEKTVLSKIKEVVNIWSKE